MRQLITESVVLRCSAVRRSCRAAAGVPLFTSLVPASLPIGAAGVDLRPVAFAAAFTALTAIGSVSSPIRAGRCTGFHGFAKAPAGGGAKERLRAALVTAEVTMSVILLITSGLLIRAVWRVQAIDPGIKADNVLTLKTALPRPRYDSPGRRGEFYERVLSRVRALPGVQSAAFTSGLPMVMAGIITAVDIPGRDPRSYRSEAVNHRWVVGRLQNQWDSGSSWPRPGRERHR